MPDPRLLAVAVGAVRAGDRVATPSPAVADALLHVVDDVTVTAVSQAAPGDFDVLVLVDDELTAAGADGEALVAEAERALVPGGVLVVGATGLLVALATAADSQAPAGAYTAAQLSRALGHRGFELELLCAPGAAARLSGDLHGPMDLERDRVDGLLDAGERLVAVARKGRDEPRRSAAFFATLPRKVVAAAVLCRDDAGRVLVVHDSFKRHWTIPGGVVDPGEDPRSGAEREAWEEAGVRVSADAILGVFAAPHPDRLVFVYRARLQGPVGETAPRHAHEIDGVAWVSVDEAMERLAPSVAEQVSRCLSEPGKTWLQPAGA